METNQSGPPGGSSGINSKILEAYPRALLFAHRKLAKYANTGLPARASPQDITHEAVIKVLTGVRPWNQEKTPDLFVHLAGCINSILNNHYTSADFSLTDGSDPEPRLLNTIACEYSLEDSMEFESKVAFVIDYLASIRDDLKQTAELMLKDGVTEPKEIALILGMTVKDVNTKKLAIKRIMQRADFLLHHIENNRRDLIAIATAIYKHKITSAHKLSTILNMPAADVRKQRRELYCVIEEIHRGSI